MGRKTAILIRRGKDRELQNTKLMEGELAFTTDEKELFVGSKNGNVKINSIKPSMYMEVSRYDTDGNGIVNRASVADSAENAKTANRALKLGSLSERDIVTKEAITWAQLKGVW